MRSQLKSSIERSRFNLFYYLLFGFRSLFLSFFLSLSLGLSPRRVLERGGGCSSHGSVHHALQSDSAGGESSYRGVPSAPVSKHFTWCHTISLGVTSSLHQNRASPGKTCAAANVDNNNNQVSLRVPLCVTLV